MDGPVYLRFVVSLVLVLGLMLAVLWALRRFGLGGMVARPSAHRRLSVVETMVLDGRRRLVLVKRDDCEHLLMIGGPNDMVIERVPAPEALKEDQV